MASNLPIYRFVGPIERSRLDGPQTTAAPRALGSASAEADRRGLIRGMLVGAPLSLALWAAIAALVLRFF
jgi:hypothetical protein